MLYNLKTYQRDAVDEIKEYFDFNFDKNNKTIVLKSPTGSGKTLMISSVIEEEVTERENDNFCFVWASIGKGELQKQSYYSVKSYVQGHPVCTLLEEDFFGSRRFIKNKEVVFVNWEKLVSKDRETGEWKNNLMKDSEGHNFLDAIKQTKENGTKIILIVDESHIGSSSNTRIAEFRDKILQPDMTIEMSATPSSNPDVSVNPQHVIDEGIIKEDVIVNEGISVKDETLTEKDSELLVLESAEAKRQEIIAAYQEVGANVNPLVLVQIPNTDAGEAKKIVVKDFLSERGITEENNQLKLWFDNNSNFDKNAIKRNDDETNYLIFKTAVATGWDCPRAHILVKFREGHSETFEIQTIGRILRTAEAKKYENPILDNAYIFTNITSFETTPGPYTDIIKTEFSYMREPYTKQSVWEQTLLNSFYRSREGNYNSADSRFNEFFEKEFMKYFNFKEEDKYLQWTVNAEKLESKGMNLNIKTQDSMITETVINTGDVDNSQKISAETTTVRMSENDIQAKFYEIIKANLNGLAYVRSKSPINTAVVDVLGKFYNAFSRAAKITATHKLMVQNPEIFAEILNNATADFREMLQEQSGLKGIHYDFKIEDKRGYSRDTHKVLDLDKSLYQPLRVLITNHETGDVNKLEKKFLTYLNNSDQVEWFWENGTEWIRTNFGISYNNGLNTFQPDFLVKFKNGNVGIFDTKPIDFNVEDTTVKAEALWKFISDTNKDRGDLPKVVGGIVVEKGGAFYYYNEEKYVDMNEDDSNWHLFHEIF